MTVGELKAILEHVLNDVELRIEVWDARQKLGIWMGPESLRLEWDPGELDTPRFIIRPEKP